MLSFFRNNVQSVFIRTIVSVVALVMLFFGIDSFQNQGINVIATVGSKEIKLEQYQRSLEGATEQVRKAYGPNADQFMKMMNIKMQVLQRLISDALMIESAHAVGLALTDKELATALRGFAQFQTDGRYDPQKYKLLLKQIGQSSPEFEASFRDNMLASKYMALLSQGHLVSQQYAEMIYSRDETQYDIETLTVGTSDIQVKASVNDDEINSFYEKNSARFQAPAKVGIQFFTVGIGEVTSSAKVSDKAVELYYKKHKTKEFSKKPSYHAHHILIKLPRSPSALQKTVARTKAEGIYNQLKADPASFEGVAKKRSQDPGSARNEGDLGWVEEGQFVPVFDRVVTGLKPGQVSQPFLSQFGYHIAKLVATKPAGTLSLEEARPQIIARLNQQKGERRLKNLHRKATQSLVDQSLEAYAKSENKTLKKSGLFAPGTSVPGLPNLRSLYQQLISKPVNEKGAILEGSFVVVYQITETKEPTTQPLEDIKPEVERLAQMAKEQQMVASQLEHMAQRITTSESFDQLGAGMKQTPAQLHLSYKDRQFKGLKAGRELPIALNHMKPGEVKFLSSQGQGYAVRLLKKSVPTIEGKPLGLERFKASLSQQKAQILVNGLIDELRKTTEITYNEKLLKTLGINQES